LPNEIPVSRLFSVAILEFPAAVIIVDDEGIVQDLNDHFSSRIGYSRADLVGRPVTGCIPDDVKDKHDSYLTTYFKRPMSRSMGSGRSRVRIKCANGVVVPAEIGLIPCPGEDCAAAVVSPLARPGQGKAFRRRLALGMFFLVLGISLTTLGQTVEWLSELPDGQIFMGAGATLLLGLAPSIGEKGDEGA